MMKYADVAKFGKGRRASPVSSLCELQGNSVPLRSAFLDLL